MRYLFPLSPYNQQRQFQKPVWVYPAHLAMYATHLRNEGHEVYWDDVKNTPLHEQLNLIQNDFQIDVPRIRAGSHMAITSVILLLT